MKTTILQRQPSTHEPFESDILLSLPFPACIFSIETEIVVLSNSYFNYDTELPLLNLLNTYNYHFLKENDMKILLHRIATENQIQTQRFDNQNKDGKIHEIHISRIPNKNFALLFFFPARSIESSSYENQFFKNLFQKLPEGIAVIDEHFRIRFYNQTFACFFNKTENIVGDHILDYIDSNNRLLFESELENQKLLLDSEFEINLKSENNDRYVFFHIIPQIKNNIKYNGSLLILTDLSNHIAYEKELNQVKRKAKEAENLKSTFLANISHEIRTPMNCIMGFSTLLKKENLNKTKRNQYIDLIVSRGKELLDIINNIIEITRIEENQIKLDFAPCNLTEIFENLKLYCNTELQNVKKQNIKIVIKTLPDSEKNIILTDSVRLQQVLTHLLNNSIKFTSEGYIETGYTFEDSENILFYVKDTGIGIPEGLHRIIFERFRQADESFTRTYPGTGLGLSICEGIIKLFNGRIWTESDGTNGSVFYFTIPYSSILKEKPDTKKTQNENNYYWPGQNILIVEDDETCYEFLNEVLSFTGCNMYHAHHGKDALEILEKQKIDLVLLDIQLPEMDGFQVAKTIRKTNSTIPIIAQTAHALAGDRKRCIDAGCSAYISKPLQFELLLDTINNYLRN
jgi:signal transduction histidine kinase